MGDLLSDMIVMFYGRVTISVENLTEFNVCMYQNSQHAFCTIKYCRLESLNVENIVMNSLSLNSARHGFKKIKNANTKKIVNTLNPRIKAWCNGGIELHTVFVTNQTIGLNQHNVALIITMVVVTLQYYCAFK